MNKIKELITKLKIRRNMHQSKNKNPFKSPQNSFVGPFFHSKTQKAMMEVYKKYNSFVGWYSGKKRSLSNKNLRYKLCQLLFKIRRCRISLKDPMVKKTVVFHFKISETNKRQMRFGLWAKLIFLFW